MTHVNAVNEAEDVPNVAAPRQKAKFAYPYWDLASAIEVAKVIHEQFGGSCDNAQLALALGYSGVRNGSFRTRVSSTRMFGLIEGDDGGKLRLTTRGRHVVSPVTQAEERNARVDAFMSVDLFKQVFDRFHGTTLPENVGLRNLLANEYNIVPDRVGPTVRILLDSAQQAGLFHASGNRSRMVMPFGPSGVNASHTPPAPANVVNPPDPPPPRGGNGGSVEEELGIDPAILGLLKRLPPGGTPMTAKRRKALIDAFTNVVQFIYPDADEMNE